MVSRPFALHLLAHAQSDLGVISYGDLFCPAIDPVLDTDLQGRNGECV